MWASIYLTYGVRSLDKDEILKKIENLYEHIEDFETNSTIGPQSLRDLIVEGMMDQIKELEDKLDEK